MATGEEAQREIMDALHDHFDRTGTALAPEEIAEMTALDIDAVKNALRVLKKANRIEGVEVSEIDYPLKVTSIVYE